MPMPRVMASARKVRGRTRYLNLPLANSSRKKPRRWPLVLRFTKGSVHRAVWLPVLAHAMFTAFVVWLNTHISRDVALPSSIIPSLSIVVGLMLVFRNQTAYQRFWSGRLHLNTVTTSVRCLARHILSGVPHADAADLSSPDKHKILETVKMLIAVLYTIKNHLRTEWGVMVSPGTILVQEEGQITASNEYKDLLPIGLRGYEDKGLGLTLELTVFVEQFINKGTELGWFHNACSGTMLGELNALTRAYGEMEVIRLVPIPVAHLIHHQQTLAIFCIFLPFAMATDMGWWAIPLVMFVAFTLYGIEGIAQNFEDPFGKAKIDINLDDVVADTRKEVEVLMAIWLRGGAMFAPASRSRWQSVGAGAVWGGAGGGGGGGGGAGEEREWAEAQVADEGRGSIVEGIDVMRVSGGDGGRAGPKTMVGRGSGGESAEGLLGGDGAGYGFI